MFEVTHDDGVAVLRIGHGKVNALDLGLCVALAEELARLDADPDVGAVVLTGNGRVFGAGVDLPALLDGDDDAIADFLDALADLVLAPVRSDTPVVAAVDGHAIAGGAVLLLACDHALLTDDDRARIGLSELAVGVPFPPAPWTVVANRLPDLEPVVTAALYGTDEAVTRGFGNAVVRADELLDAAVAVARRLAAVPIETWRLTKTELRRPLLDGLVDSDDRHAAAQAAWSSPEVRDAITRFMASLG